MARGAADFMFGCVFDGSLSMSDMNIERRPYHKNCKCALHETKGECSHTSTQQRNVSFPKREFRKSFSISVSSSSLSSQSSYDQRISSNGSTKFSNEVQVDPSCSREQCQKPLVKKHA